MHIMYIYILMVWNRITVIIEKADDSDLDIVSHMECHILHQEESHYRGCCGNAAISNAISNHVNDREDLQWQFSCTPLPNDYILTSCSWTNWINNWDSTMNYACSGVGLIRTIHSYHSNRMHLISIHFFQSKY